jgi:7-cyano-7-deazaguanine reductase
MSDYKAAELGKASTQPASPDLAKLDAIPWQNHETMPAPCLRFTLPEFTSLCPVTGQPDFAHVTIDYIPRDFLIESKSLKLFANSFRSHAAFHELTTIAIAYRFMQAAKPNWLRVFALWYPRGGIPIDVFWQNEEPPKGYHIPEIDYKHYRGR